jgi:hypothetical protein
MVEWWLSEHMNGSTAMGHDAVDGLILDDYWSDRGPSEIDSNMLSDMGMSGAAAAAMTANWSAAMDRLFTLAASRSKFISNMGYSGDYLSGSSAATCTARLTTMCDASLPVFGHWYVVNFEYIQPPAFGITAPNALLDVAYFLLTRGPWAWIAGGPMLGWHMSHWWTAGKARPIAHRDDLRPAEFNQNFGEPLCSCVQEAPGVFVRAWSKANVSINCNTLTATIDVI